MGVCAIVGAGAGISQSAAKKFLDRGYGIALLARNSEKLAGLKEELGNDKITTWGCDAADMDKVFQTFTEIQECQGAVEVLIYNAYMAVPGRVTRLKPSDLRDTLQVNITGALAAAQQVIPKMKAAGKGTIILTGGGFALAPFQGMTALSVGKAGLRALANCMHQELGPLGIHAGTVTVCGLVKPGTFYSPDAIADAFLAFHDQPADAFEWEMMFKEAG
ncbi:MAG: SDR family NAD(P)-dependent oxidoreductase [Cyanobacteria bacterium SZAS TMP-1]|nr:SDR family NAD(P)-dependent oxidoreductase [Cyanobacteria bacterium SZAS TMP-1]